MKRDHLLLLACVAFQLIVMAGVYINAHLPEVVGDEIRVRIQPVDPRSLFRGNYVRLEYEFSSIPLENEQAQTLRVGDVIYARLAPAADGLYEFEGASFDQPDSGLYIRGRAQGDSWSSDETARVRVEYGIEALFLPLKDAIAVEQELRGGSVATLRVTSWGQSRVISIDSDCQPEQDLSGTQPCTNQSEPPS